MIDEKELIDFIRGAGNLGVDAAAISEHFGVWRNEVVRLIHSLIDEGKLVKEGSRPVRYFLPPIHTEFLPTDGLASNKEERLPFSNMIGYNGSLAMQTQMALAASSYPPNGIHTLIEGETGVGKTLLACEMARHLKMIKAQNKENAPFIMFNCAEYADNPQLLLSQLFGYAKGAFTGAMNDKAGLIEEANGGILFLDEIHRLPPTGQEMLFTVIDKGIFRRMGDTRNRVTHFMLIAATTEDPANMLLNTFRRRIPLTISIPSLSERPINERLDIISLFFSREADRLKLPIQVSCASLRLLISCKGKNNIGDLKNEIQLACARAYLKYVQNKEAAIGEAELEIDIYTLSRRLAVEFVVDERADAYFSSIGIRDGIRYVPEEFPQDNKGEYVPRFTGFFGSPIKGPPIECDSPYEAMKMALSQIEEQSNGQGKGILYGQISPVIWETTKEIMTIAEKNYEVRFSQETSNSVAYFLQQLKAYASAERMPFSPEKFESKKLKYDLSFIDQVSPIISKNLHLELMKSEAILLSRLFKQETVNETPYQNLILVGYEGAASDIAKDVNHVLGAECAIAFDITERDSNEEVESQCRSYIRDHRRDTIVLAGLGTTSFAERILDAVDGIRYCIIPYLDPTLALACGQLIYTNHPIDSIVSEILTACKEYFGISFEGCIPVSTNKYAEGEKYNQNEDMRNVIITYCITGIGSARAVRELLLKKISIVTTTDIIPLGIMDDIVSISKDFGKRLKLIIGIVNPRIPGVPFVNMEQIFSYTNIEGFLRSKGIDIPAESGLDANPADSIEMLSATARLKYCYNCLEYFSPSLEKESVDTTVRRMIQDIEKMYRLPMSPDFLVRVYIHCCTMFERMHTAKPIPMPLDADVTIKRNSEWFEKLKEIMMRACKAMNMDPIEAEVYYLMMALPTDDLIYNEDREGSEE